jgi:hypothetical protein
MNTPTASITNPRTVEMTATALVLNFGTWNVLGVNGANEQKQATSNSKVRSLVAFTELCATFDR